MRTRNDIALKVNGGIISLLSEGSVLTILTKTGDSHDDPTGRWSEFFLFPVNDELDPSTIKPDFAPQVDRANELRTTGTVKFTLYARVRAYAKFSHPSHVDLMEPFYAQTAAAAKEMLAAGSDGLNMLVLRLYKMKEPMVMVDRPMYDGTQTWVELEAPLSTRKSDAFYPRADFELRVEEIRQRAVAAGAEML